MSAGDDTDSGDGYTLELQSDGANVPITNSVPLTATLTKSGAPCASKSITFEIDSPPYDPTAQQQPYLSPGNNGTYTATTDQNGRASTILSAGGRIGNVTVAATYTTPSQRSLTPYNEINFVRPKVDSLAVTLVPASTPMCKIIQATATVKAGNSYLENIPVHMSLPRNNNGARFCDKNGTYKTGANEFHSTLTSDASGKATAYFTSPLWDSGSLLVNIDDADGTVDDEHPQYTFEYNTDVTAIFNDTEVCNNDGGSNTIAGTGSGTPVDNREDTPPQAPADGSSYLLISGWVELSGAPLGGNPTVTLQTSEPNAKFVDHDDDAPNTITVVCTEHDRYDTICHGYFEARLICDDLRKDDTGEVTDKVTGKVTVTILRDGQTAETLDPVDDAVFYEFVNPWSSVNNTNIAFNTGPNSVKNSYSIYANGLQQAPITLTFTLASAFNAKAIPPYTCPSAAAVSRQVQFLDYVSGNPIAQLTDPTIPTDETWGYDDTPNDYRQKDLDAPAPIAVLDTKSSGVSDSIATLCFYIRHGVSNNPQPLTLGVMISPTGSFLDGDTPVLEQGSPKNYSQLGEVLPDPIEVTPKPPPQLVTDSLSVTCTPFVSSRQSDDGPANLPGNPEYKENYYRRFDYEISPSSEFKDRCQFEKVSFSVVEDAVNYLKNNKCCYSSNVNELYDYRLYLWPTNISNLQNAITPTKDGTFKMQSNIDYGAKIKPQKKDNVIYVSRYIGFGAVYNKRYIQTDINILMTDDFGNTYKFYLPAETTPQKYEKLKMEEFNPTNTEWGTLANIDTTNTAATYTVGGIKGVNISTRTPVLSNPPATATDCDLTYQAIQGDTSPARMTITLDHTYSYAASEYISPVFYLSFNDDQQCGRSIIYDSANYQNLLLCAPSSWTSGTTVRGVTLRPLWTTGRFQLGVNPTVDDAASSGNVLYACISTSINTTVSIQQWSSDDLMVWRVGT